MKKSFLSKLLAGSISLGLLSGVNSVKNAFAVSDFDEEDIDIDVDEDDSKNSENLDVNNSNNSIINSLCRVGCLVGDLIPGAGTIYGHALFGTSNETIAAWATLGAAALGCCTLPKVVFTKEEKEKLGECFNKLKNKNHGFNENGEVIDTSNNDVILDKEEGELYWKFWLALGGPWALYIAGWPAYDIIQLINKR